MRGRLCRGSRERRRDVRLRRARRHSESALADNAVRLPKIDREMAREKKDFLAFEISPVHRSTVSDKTNAPTDRRDGRLTAARRSRNEAAERLVKALGHAIACWPFSGEHQQNTEDVCRLLSPPRARGRGHARERSGAAEAWCVSPSRLTRRPSRRVSGATGKISFPSPFRVLGFVSPGETRVRARRGERGDRPRTPPPPRVTPSAADRRRLVRPSDRRARRNAPSRCGARRAAPLLDNVVFFALPRWLSSRASSPAFDP